MLLHLLISGVDDGLEGKDGEEKQDSGAQKSIQSEYRDQRKYGVATHRRRKPRIS